MLCRQTQRASALAAVRGLPAASCCGQCRDAEPGVLYFKGRYLGLEENEITGLYLLSTSSQIKGFSFIFHEKK